jgi:hypothetical protein
MPYKSWDEPEATVDEVHGKGYCVHANCLFPLWHRPYLLLYEVPQLSSDTRDIALILTNNA